MAREPNFSKVKRGPPLSLQVYMSDGDHLGLISATIKYGDAAKGGDPQLWAEVLEYFVMQPGNCTEQVSFCLAARRLPSHLPRVSCHCHVYGFHCIECAVHPEPKWFIADKPS